MMLLHPCTWKWAVSAQLKLSLSSSRACRRQPLSSACECLPSCLLLLFICVPSRYKTFSTLPLHRIEPSRIPYLKLDRWPQLAHRAPFRPSLPTRGLDSRVKTSPIGGPTCQQGAQHLLLPSPGRTALLPGINSPSPTFPW